MYRIPKELNLSPLVGEFTTQLMIGLTNSNPNFFSMAILAVFLALPCGTRAADELVGSTPLPAQVPYLSQRGNFFLGNGLVGGGGAGDGTWNFLTGPDYTCPNYLNREEIKLMVDGTEQALTLDVHRGRKTGIYYGITTVGDLEIRLVDGTLSGEPWIARLITIKNKSRTIRHDVSVRAYITPIVGAGRSDWLARDENGHNCGVGLKLDTSLKCVKGWACPNWTNRYALITFNEPANAEPANAITDTATAGTNHEYRIETGSKPLAPGGVWNVALYHYLHFDGENDGDVIKLVEQRDIVSDISRDIVWWEHWFDETAPEYSLDRIPDQRARDLVEGGLATLKMNQSCDGGIVANERGWSMSYIRDAYCGLRGLVAFGHFEESKSFIQWLNHKFAVHGLIGDAESCGSDSGSDSYMHPNGNTGKYCAEANAIVEVTALYLLMARDYYQGTHDLRTLTNANTSLRYAMDVQLRYAATNGYRLEFSGDETELCRAAPVDATGYNRHLDQYWSMTSVALCSASLDFYMQYLRAQGEDPAHYLNRQNNRVLNLPVELSRLQDALERDYWRTNLPECPGGFHDWYRVKKNNAWPVGRVVNFTLFPVYYGTPLKYPDRAKDDVIAMKQFFNPATRSLPLMGKPGGRSLGHDLGYLLWGLVAIDDPEKAAVYDALVNGPTVGCWGTYNEAYDAEGRPNANDLRTFETGVNLSAIGKYWGVGDKQSNPTDN
jgi:hypothetical protein